MEVHLAYSFRWECPKCEAVEHVDDVWIGNFTPDSEDMLEKRIIAALEPPRDADYITSEGHFVDDLHIVSVWRPTRVVCTRCDAEFDVDPEPWSMEKGGTSMRRHKKRLGEYWEKLHAERREWARLVAFAFFTGASVVALVWYACG